MTADAMKLEKGEDEDDLKLLVVMMQEGVGLELFHCAVNVGELRDDETMNGDQVEADETIVHESEMVQLEEATLVNQCAATLCVSLSQLCAKNVMILIQVSQLQLNLNNLPI